MCFQRSFDVRQKKQAQYNTTNQAVFDKDAWGDILSASDYVHKSSPPNKTRGTLVRPDFEASDWRIIGQLAARERDAFARATPRVILTLCMRHSEPQVELKTPQRGAGSCPLYGVSTRHSAQCCCFFSCVCRLCLQGQTG
ncbi:hypothetical protein BaRGS_00010055 [Batillaria attramentaria]|uniref:Uncharacterized protein n=1 Tax=Batillaria attramentaria TaxID=370345 RepID=A0ABD0LHU8_9CAEN